MPSKSYIQSLQLLRVSNKRHQPISNSNAPTVSNQVRRLVAENLKSIAPFARTNKAHQSAAPLNPKGSFIRWWLGAVSSFNPGRDHDLHPAKDWSRIAKRPAHRIGPAEHNGA